MHLSLRFFSLGLLLSGTLPLGAADKPLKPAEAGNELVEITATALIDRAAVTAALEEDPGLDMIAVEVRFAPRGDNKLTLWHDDFTIISRRDGQRSQPLSPGQIAGRGALMVTNSGRVQGQRSGIMTGNRGPIIGGMPGTGIDNRPRRIGGNPEAIVGGEADASGDTQAKVQEAKSEGENPRLAALKRKLLKEGETNEAVTGYLYFLLEGKYKLKDLELLYKSPAGQLDLDFLP